MIERSKKTNLLEQSLYRYSLQDIENPNLYRQIYPYDAVPKVTFNHRHVPINMPNDIWITDTTFRDGQQSRAPYEVHQIVDLFQMMSRLGGPNGMIRQTEFFMYSQKDREALYKCMELGLEFPEITTWIRASKEDFKLVKDIGVKETGILVSCSDYHNFKKLGKTRKQAMEMYLSVVAQALEMGIRPRCHLEDITRADFYGFVVPFVNELMKMSKEAGIPVKIRACNAWLYGASAVNCTLLGIGERTGNVPLEAMVFEYASMTGDFNGMDPTVITEIADYYEKEIGYHIPEMTPFVGKNFNVTRAGIHADGLLKDEEIYNIFDTQKILSRPAEVSISNTSGLAGIAYWINVHYRLNGDSQVQKRSPLVSYIKEWVDSQYAMGRQTVMSDEEIEKLVEEFQSSKK